MPAPRATQAVIRNAIQAAQDCGVAIGAVEVAKDGTVRIVAKKDGTELLSPDAPPKWGQVG
jgi:uncharacterized protein GlcG (DUF336 family)